MNVVELIHQTVTTKISVEEVSSVLAEVKSLGDAEISITDDGNLVIVVTGDMNDEDNCGTYISLEFDSGVVIMTTMSLFDAMS